MNRLKRDIARHFNIDPATAGVLISGLLSLMIDEQSGGVEGFIARFRSIRLGSAVDSWVDGITMQSLNEKQVRRALGADAIEDLATAAGLGRGGTVAILTYLIPRLVNRSTPGGKVPTTEELRTRTSRFREAHDGYVLPPGRRASAREAAARDGTAADGEAAASVRSVDRRGAARRRRRSPALLVLAWLSIPAAAVAAWLFLRPIIPTAGPTATAEMPVLEVNNAGESVTYTGQVRDESARATIAEALNSTFGEERVSGDVRVDEDVGDAAWVDHLDALLMALDTPGAVVVLTGDSARVTGRLTGEARASLADRIRDALGGTAAVAADTTDGAEEEAGEPGNGGGDRAGGVEETAPGSGSGSP